MESTLFVPSKLTFSENLRCLNLALLVGAVSQKRSLSSTCFVIAGQSIHSGKFKHLKYSENVNFEETSNVVSILTLWYVVLCWVRVKLASYELSCRRFSNSVQSFNTELRTQKIYVELLFIQVWHYAEYWRVTTVCAELRCSWPNLVFINQILNH